jgi:hypothetical protein
MNAARVDRQRPTRPGANVVDGGSNYELPDTRAASASGGRRHPHRPHHHHQASVKDVEIELAGRGAGGAGHLYFLRNAGTIIPSQPVPLSLIGTFAVMYLAASVSTTRR